jgi:hypothetical protein
MVCPLTGSSDDRPAVVEIDASEQIASATIPDEIVTRPSTPVPYEELPEAFQDKLEEYLVEMGVNAEVMEGIRNYEMGSSIRFMKSFKKLLLSE